MNDNIPSTGPLFSRLWVDTFKRWFATSRRCLSVSWFSLYLFIGWTQPRSLVLLYRLSSPDAVRLTLRVNTVRPSRYCFVVSHLPTRTEVRWGQVVQAGTNDSRHTVC